MRRVALLGALLLIGCQDYIFVFQENQRIEGRKYVTEIRTEGNTDILFVIDNSASMATEQAKLKENMSRFIDVLTRSVNNYQVGVVSTDTFLVPKGPGCYPCCDIDTTGDGLPDWSNCDGGRLVAADGRTRIFRRPHSDDPARLKELERELVGDFNSVVTSLGVVGHVTEATLEAMRMALDSRNPDAAVPILNHGFLRSESDLAIIFLTDEDDCSFDRNWYTQPSFDDSQCYSEVRDAIPVSEYLDFLAEIKGGDIRRIRAAAITGAVATNDPSYPLGFKPAGCFTVDSPGSPEHGEASSECGCWSARFMPDRRAEREGDFYCNYIGDEPFNQLYQRVPDRGLGQGGCDTMPGTRFVNFLTELGARREAAGESRGVLVDSICRADYGETLENIALTIVLDNCFDLREAPTEDMGSVQMLHNGRQLNRVDRQSSEEGWSYDEATNRICLEGGLIKQVGDVFEIFVLSDVRGFPTAG